MTERTKKAYYQSVRITSKIKYYATAESKEINYTNRMQLFIISCTLFAMGHPLLPDRKLSGAGTDYLFLRCPTTDAPVRRASIQLVHRHQSFHK